MEEPEKLVGTEVCRVRRRTSQAPLQADAMNPGSLW